MPALVFQLAESLLAEALRAILSNGPRRAGEQLRTDPYSQSSEVVNGPGAPPLYTLDAKGVISLAYPTPPTWALKAPPAPPRHRRMPILPT